MNTKLWTPWFIENSKVPVYLSYLSPITIGAITVGPWVFSRREISEQTKRHETIHWQQYIDLGIIGFPIVYLFFWLLGLIKYQDGVIAYGMNPLEQEAYENDEDEFYLIKR